MDDPIAQIKGTLEAATAFENASIKTLSFLERRGWLPVSKKRERNMLNVRQIELNLEAMEHRHRLRLRLEDALAEAKAGIISQSAMLAVEQLQQIDGKAMSEEDKMEILDSASRAATRVYKQAMDDQYAIERISLYALREAAENPEEKVGADEPSDTWMNKFMKYGADIRDEDVIRLWGQILAGEIKAPGSYSFKTLDILSTLDKRDAEAFQKISPYIMQYDFIPAAAWEACGVSVLEAANLDSLGLIIRHMRKQFRIAPISYNRHYEVSPKVKLPPSLCEFDFDCALLTPAGAQLYSLLSVSEEDSKMGAEFFCKVVDNKYCIGMDAKRVNIIK